MSEIKYSPSRRSLLRGMTALAGAYFASPLIWGLRQAHAAYETTKPKLDKDFGAGRSVAIIGGGVAGLTAAYTLANAGFKVAVFEADTRYGGRSLTARPSDARYRDWWFEKYNPEKRFPAMYVDRYQERPESPAAGEQICTFMDDKWAANDYRGNPVELFLNAGPGRIPSIHVDLIALCQEIGVALEPYFFLSTSNLLQNDTFRGGEPIPFGQVNYSLFNQMAAMMYKVTQEVVKLQGGIGSEEASTLDDLYRLFGDLTKDGQTQKTSRLGYIKLPGGWRDAGIEREPMPVDQILASDFIGKADENPELSPGSFLFNSYNIDWQPTLMQPVGGMDRIWQQLLLQDVPSTAFWDTDIQKKSGENPKVGDLVLLETGVSNVTVLDKGASLTFQQPGRNAPSKVTFDFCVSTMAPSLLKAVLEPDNIPPDFLAGLAEFSKTGGDWGSDPTPDLWTPAIKVGWQGKDRFWETKNEIYGGISWTTDIIGQIWYPSEDFTAHTGILTGAYNRGQLATVYARQNQEQRLATARVGLGKLHKGEEDNVTHGMSIAWQYMPHQVGGWASDTATTNQAVYQQITTFKENGYFYCAGDTWSYWPGWQEGSVASAYCAVDAIAQTIRAGK
ncbi:monoamine oxidase [Neorhizobium huautlense]|uniref:Monoamine oxidase n=1 Tax=Neorhizobium huautlense TaxID=67774 RepID=A0ABT9PMB3_9HYPH|nr:FAD-dependent oxidoreductase [Neorhizobium huautlense]MDP9835604.1 monoamine oxidase [Neorhizobium huautlense]